MWGSALAAFLLGLLALMVPLDHGNEGQAGYDKGDSQAKHFIVYRDAVNEYALANPSATGFIAVASLDLPVGWMNLGGWSNSLDSGRVYVFGSMLPGGVSQVLRSMANTYTVGVKESWQLVSPRYGATGVALPGYIPSGSIVSVINY